MNSSAQVAEMIAEWKRQEKSKEQIVALAAEATIGWPYVWGARGAECTVPQRQYYMNRSSIGEGDRELIKKRCQVLNGSSSSCHGCKYFPGDQKTLAYDCRGYTWWLLSKVGVTLNGAGAASQWNDNSNWSEKGTIDKIPKDKVCCVFKKVGDKMEHTGMHVGDGEIIHCSVEVKRSSVTDTSWKWSHYAIPKNLNGGVVPVWRPTIRKGSTGEDVVYCQQLLMSLGYDLSPYNADGKFGNKTRQAVMDFQRANSLGVDGVVGPMTWQALENASPSDKKYTVTIPHLTSSQANSLKDQYSDASIKEE